MSPNFFSVRHYLVFLLSLPIIAAAGCAQLETKEINREAYQKFLDSVNYNRQYPLRRTPGDITYLRHALKEKSSLVRYNTAQDILAMGDQAKEMRPELEHCAKDRVKKIAAVCRRALADLSPADNLEPPVPAAPQAIAPAENITRAPVAVVSAPPAASPSSPPPVPQTPPQAKNPGEALPEVDSARVLRCAEQALRNYARSNLQRKDPDQLAKWRREIPYLERKLASDKIPERVAAVEVLRNMSAYLDEAIAPLFAALRNVAPLVRAKAALALGEARDERAVDDLVRMLSEGDAVPEVGAALQLIGSEKAMRAVGPKISSGALKKLTVNQVTLRGRPHPNARELRRICYRLLAERGVSGPALNSESKLCVQEAGAYY